MRNLRSNILRNLAVIAVLATGLTAVMPSQALAYRHHACCWGWGLGAGLAAGALWWPGYGYYYPYGPYAYYPPASTTVIQQVPVAAAPQQAQSYYYCSNPKGYYPYVQTCQTQWQPVSTVPSAAPQSLTK